MVNPLYYQFDISMARPTTEAKDLHSNRETNKVNKPNCKNRSVNKNSNTRATKKHNNNRSLKRNNRWKKI